jgi:hypothetical protein
VTALVTLPRDLVTYADEPDVVETPSAGAPPATTFVDTPTIEGDTATFAPPSEPAVTDRADSAAEALLPPPPSDADTLPPPPAAEPVVESPADALPTRGAEPTADDIVVEPQPAEGVDESGGPPVFGDIPSDDLLDELVEEVVPEGDEFERGLQSLVDDELAPGPIEPPAPAAAPGLTDSGSAPGAFGGVAVEEPEAPEAPSVAEPAAAQSAEAEAAAKTAAELTAAGLVRRTPKKRSADPVGGGMPTVAPARSSGQSNRSPEEVRKMLSRYRSGLNKGRGDADSEGNS